MSWVLFLARANYRSIYLSIYLSIDLSIYQHFHDKLVHLTLPSFQAASYTRYTRSCAWPGNVEYVGSPGSQGFDAFF